MRSGAERDDLLFLYSAGALEGDEREEVEAWLAESGEQATARLVAAEAELADFAALLPPADPSSAVRERLLARIGASGRTRAPHARRRSAVWLRPALAAGLAALVAGALGIALGRRAAPRIEPMELAKLRADLDGVAAEVAAARDALAETQAERDELEEELATLEASSRARETDLVLAHKALGVVTAEKMESLALRGGATRPAARARVFWDWDEWYCYLEAQGLEALANGVYALWLFTDLGETVAVGTFEANAAGEATFLAPVPRDIGHVVRAAISIEPDADLGSEPRGDVVLHGGA